MRANRPQKHRRERVRGCRATIRLAAIRHAAATGRQAVLPELVPARSAVRRSTPLAAVPKTILPTRDSSLPIMTRHAEGRKPKIPRQYWAPAPPAILPCLFQMICDSHSQIVLWGWASTRTSASTTRRPPSPRCPALPAKASVWRPRLPPWPPRAPTARNLAAATTKSRPARCPLWCREVPKMVPYASHRGRHGWHRIAPKSRPAQKNRRPEDRRKPKRGWDFLHPAGPICIDLHRPNGWRKSSTPQWARTTNLRFRRPMLYPIELGVRIAAVLHGKTRQYHRQRRSTRGVGRDESVRRVGGGVGRWRPGRPTRPCRPIG